MSEKQEKVIMWTDDQRSAIETTGKNLLVSASAGSGKTTVMIQRIIHLMQTENLPISSFLVVTFTKASASDMKQKLIEKLSKLEQSENIASQIELVETSDISNLHSFCSRLVQSYFYEVDVDPAFHIIDGTDAEFLKQKAAEKLFEEKEKNGDESYFELFEIFQKKRQTSKFKEIIFKFSDYLNSNIDGKKWFEDCLKISYNLDLNNNECAKTINNSVCGRVAEVVDEINEIANLSNELGCDAYYDYFVDLASKLSAINVRNSYIVNAKNVFEFSVPKRPTLKGFEELKFQAEQVLKDLKQKINNFKNNFVSADENELITGLETSKKYLNNLFKITLEFDEIYSKIKKDVNGLDFHDLEILALKILENPAIKESVRKKYAYVFVDEYQDINAVQEEIISRVSSDSNRFMVGDIKQSIYGFRLCDPEIFLSKQVSYAAQNNDNMLIHLNCNFRSDKKILKFVDSVFSGVMTEKFGGVDYQKDSKFEPGKDNLDAEKSLNLCFINTDAAVDKNAEISGVYSVKNHTEEESEETAVAIAEATYVASKIAELVDVKNEKAIKYSDIAILVQSRNNKIKKFIETLKGFGVPVSSDEDYDLMQKDYVQEIVNFVKLSVSEKDDILMFKVMKSRLFAFSNDELVSLRKLNPSIRFFDLCSLDKFIADKNLLKKVQYFNEKLKQFQKLARLLNLKEFVKKVIDEFSLYEINFATFGGEGIVDDINKFISLLPDTTCTNFVLEYENLVLKAENLNGDDAVSVMTIHKSKGIEFKSVFLVNTSNAFNFKSTYGDILFDKNFGAALATFNLETRVKNDTIALSAVRIATKKRLVEESQRVLYVALTRAKEKMFIVCSKNKDDLNSEFPKNPNSFLCWFEKAIYDELAGKHNNLITFEEFDVEDLLISTKPEKNELILKSGEEIKKESFKYVYEDLTRIPQKNSVSKILKASDEDLEYEQKVLSEEHMISSAERGTVYHKVFQNIDIKNVHNIKEQLCKIKETLLSENERKLIEDDKVVAVFNNELFNNISNDAIVLKEREFYAKMPTSLLNHASNDTFVLQGVIDLIIFDGNETIVLDYKTGSYSAEKLEKYKFQLHTYSSVVERAYKRPVTQKFIYFVDMQKIVKI